MEVIVFYSVKSNSQSRDVLGLWLITQHRRRSTNHIHIVK